jgi:alpha-glucosidase
MVRRRLLGADDAPLRWRESLPGTLAFDRPGALTCIVNLTADPIALDGRPLLISRDQDDPMLLSPGCAAWLGGGWSPELGRG